MAFGTERLARRMLGEAKALNVPVYLDDVEPMAHAMDVTNVLRPDEAAVGMDVQKVLANAPDKSEPFFKVPKVLGDASGA